MAEKYRVGVPMQDVKGYLNIDDAKKIIEMGCLNYRDKVLFTLFLHTGRRVSEVVGKDGIIPSDINEQEGLIYFTILKKKAKYRKPFPVDRNTISMLLDYVKNNNIGPGDKIFPITRQRVHQLIRAAGKRVGIEFVGKKPLHIHILRHTFAVHMARTIQSSDGLKIVADLLQHSSIDVTSFYLQFSPKDQKKLLETAWGE